MYSDDQLQNFWKLGRLEQLLQVGDGQRVATVGVSKSGRTSTLDCSIQHLYPLEVVSCNSIYGGRARRQFGGQMSQDLNLNNHVSVPYDSDGWLRIQTEFVN